MNTEHMNLILQLRKEGCSPGEISAILEDLKRLNLPKISDDFYFPKKKDYIDKHYLK